MISHDILPNLAEAYLDDPTVSHACAREFSERVALACSESPAALRRLIELRPVTAKNAQQYAEFLERALPNWNSDELEREFLDWLERRTSERAVLETIEFRRLCFRRPKQELLLSPSQQSAWEHLHRLADLYFSDTWHRHRIAPNFNVLLAAPSGAGKSFLVSAFAAARGLPLMRLTYSQWIVQGARRQPDTIGKLAAFVARHEQCVLFIDEVDKAGTGESLSDWAAAVAGEVYLTLDRTIFDGRMEGTEKERRVLSARLRRNVMIVVAGTWQWVFRGAGRRVGFAGPADFDPAAAIARAHSIPEELLRRVGGNPVFLQPPSADDLRAMCKAEALDVMARQVGLRLEYEQAVESGDAMRWLGSLRLRVELLRHARVHPHWRAPAPTCRGDGTGRKSHRNQNMATGVSKMPVPKPPGKREESFGAREVKTNTTAPINHLSAIMFRSNWMIPVYYVVAFLAVVPSHGLEHHLNNVKNPLLLLIMAFTGFMVLMHPLVILSEGLSYVIVAIAAPAHARARLMVGGLIKFGVSTMSCVAAWWFMFTYVIEPR